MKQYITDGQEIYRQSFSIIRQEADLELFDADAEPVAVRMIHASGDVDLAHDIEFSPHLVSTARAALEAGKPILTDVTMVATGITPSRLPAHNPVICTINDPKTRERAHALNTTRSAAAIHLWDEYLDGSVVAIGNAPTTLFYLLERLAKDPLLARPAAILGIPVGFVGAEESKTLLSHIAHDLGVEFLTVHGRRGGSAITCAAINALAARYEIAPQ